MREVVQTLWLNDVAVVTVRLDKNTFESVHLCQVGDRHPRMRIGEPDTVAASKARVAINAQTEMTR